MEPLSQSAAGGVSQTTSSHGSQTGHIGQGNRISGYSQVPLTHMPGLSNMAIDPSPGQNESGGVVHPPSQLDPVSAPPVSGTDESSPHAAKIQTTQNAQTLPMRRRVGSVELCAQRVAHQTPRKRHLLQYVPVSKKLSMRSWRSTWRAMSRGTNSSTKVSTFGSVSPNRCLVS